MKHNTKIGKANAAHQRRMMRRVSRERADEMYYNELHQAQERYAQALERAAWRYAQRCS